MGTNNKEYQREYMRRKRAEAKARASEPTQSLIESIKMADTSPDQRVPQGSPVKKNVLAELGDLVSDRWVDIGVGIGIVAVVVWVCISFFSPSNKNTAQSTDRAYEGDYDN